MSLYILVSDIETDEEGDAEDEVVYDTSLTNTLIPENQVAQFVILINESIKDNCREATRGNSMRLSPHIGTGTLWDQSTLQ